MSYVYLIGVEKTRLYKIGRAIDPKKRFQFLQTASPYPMRLVATIKCADAGQLENNLHRQYEQKRASGEWFRLSKSDVSALLKELAVDGCDVTDMRPRREPKPRNVPEDPLLVWDLSKEWTPAEVAELAALAKQKGIGKEELAREWLGVFPTTLSYWMSESASYREPTPMAKKLLSCIEPKIRSRKDAK